jgi:hypothetical protein
MPDRVADTIVDLHERGEWVLEQGIRWIPSNWKVENLAPFHELIDEIAKSNDQEPTATRGSRLIRRRHVIGFRRDAVALFMASMIWGYGTIGYGPERVGRIVQASGLELAARLDGIVSAAKEGPWQAWDALTRTSKLRGLGPAFATKLAYFSAVDEPAQPTRPLIADANTSWAMWDLVKLPRSVERRASYLSYVELAHSWAAERGWRADDVERALFEIGKTVPRRVAYR